MILKQKKDCKLIFNNNRYYIHTGKFLYHFGEDVDEAERYYENIREIEKDGFTRYYLNGKFRVEVYPYELEILIKSLECYKFFIDNNRFLDISKDKLDEKNFDIEFLVQFLYSMYTEFLKRDEG